MILATAVHSPLILICLAIVWVIIFHRKRTE